MKITILGHVCIDKNTSENASYMAAGSPAIFISKIFNQLPDTYLTIISPYGTDFLKYKGKAKLYPVHPKSLNTLIYENNTKSGTRTQKAYNLGSTAPVPLDSRAQELIKRSDIVFAAPLVPNFSDKYLKKALYSTKPNSLKVLLPQGFYRDFDSNGNVITRLFHEAGGLVPLFDVVIVSEQDHPDMINEARIWTQRYNILVIITLGEKGALALTANMEIKLPTRILLKSEIIDSVGSGDIFSAGFSYRYFQTHNIEESGRFANELARQCLLYTPDEIKIDYQALINKKRLIT